MEYIPGEQMNKRSPDTIKSLEAIEKFTLPMLNISPMPLITKTSGSGIWRQKPLATWGK
jgi:hypothetical protein